MEVYEVIKEYLEKGMTGTVATIADKLGAAPREEGAKMFVGEDGRFFGTIGGGCMEAEVWQEARKVMKTKEAKFVQYRMNSKEVEDGGMVCGGNVDIFWSPFTGTTRTFTGPYRTLRNGGDGYRGHPVGKDYLYKSLVDAYGGQWGDPIDSREIEAYSRFFADKRPTILTGGVVVEPIRIGSTLYIFGAGHISRYVAQAAKMVDFNVAVIDDRGDFANEERFRRRIG